MSALTIFGIGFIAGFVVAFAIAVILLLDFQYTK